MVAVASGVRQHGIDYGIVICRGNVLSQGFYRQLAASSPHFFYQRHRAVRQPFDGCNHIQPVFGLHAVNALVWRTHYFCDGFQICVGNDVLPARCLYFRVAVAGDNVFDRICVDNVLVSGNVQPVLSRLLYRFFIDFEVVYKRLAALFVAPSLHEVADFFFCAADKGGNIRHRLIQPHQRLADDLQLVFLVSLADADTEALRDVLVKRGRKRGVLQRGVAGHPPGGGDLRGKVAADGVGFCLLRRRPFGALHVARNIAFQFCLPGTLQFVQ